MADPLRVESILGDRPYAEIGEPILAVTAEGRLAVAGEFVHESNRAPVAVYHTSDLSCEAVVRSRYPVHALAFHPTLPLLAIGTGRYDGGYFFEGDLLLLDVETNGVVSAFEHEFGRQVLGLEWLDDRSLRLSMAPPDDWEDRPAWTEGHVAVVRRDDWSRLAPGSIAEEELTGPRMPMPRPDGREHARTVLPADHDPRRIVRAVERLSDGRVLAALDGVAAECWSPSGELRWRIPDEYGGRDLVVTPDEQSVWVGLVRSSWLEQPQLLVRLSPADGHRLGEQSPEHEYALVRGADGRHAIASAGAQPHFNRVRIRRGRRVYVRRSESDFEWLSAADSGLTHLFPYSWVPGETHFAGPGAELADGSLVYAGTVYHGHGLQPGGAFVIRRDMTTGEPRWVFRGDVPASDLDASDDTAYAAYPNGEIVALDLRDGSVRWRHRLGGFFPTALTVTAPDQLLIGTSDGRILDCRIV